MSLENAPILAITGFFTIATGLVVLIAGYLQGRRKNLRSHKKLMMAAVFLAFAFLVQYIIRVSMGEGTKFEGNETIKNFVYLPILTVHIIFAIVTIAAVIVHVRRASRNLIKNSKVPQFPREYREQHKTFGKKVFRIWIVSYIGGIIVFFLLYVI